MRLFFSVGDPSGDVHTAHVIEELKRRQPDWEFVGYGGPDMERAGCRLDYQLTELAVMGIWRILPNLGRFLRQGLRVRRLLRQHRPDAVILVDFPGFNWWVARFAKSAGIPVYYYLPPQIWAWATYRVSRMQRWVDRVLACMPFEPEWYAERGVKAEYVGHPIFDELAGKPLDDAFLEEQRQREGPIVAVLPGSRKQEVSANWPVQLATIEQLTRRVPSARFLVANYKETQKQFCEATLAQRADALPVECHVGRTSEIIELADVCLMVSGSVSLELLVRATPAAVIYRGNWAFAIFCRYVIESVYISLPNIFARRMLMPEFYVTGPLQSHVAQIVDQLAWWLTDDTELQRRTAQMTELRDRVAVRGAVNRAADAIIDGLTADQVPQTG